jgi:hypothetical protein
MLRKSAKSVDLVVEGILHNPPLFTFPMVGTHKANAEAHPGWVVVGNNQKKRCTKEQIKADEAHTRAHTIASREAILAREQEILTHIGVTEDFIQQEDNMLQAHAERPDLCPSSQSLKWKHWHLRTRQLHTRTEPQKTRTGKCTAPVAIEGWKVT